MCSCTFQAVQTCPTLRHLIFRTWLVSPLAWIAGKKKKHLQYIGLAKNMITGCEPMVNDGGWWWLIVVSDGYWWLMMVDNGESIIGWMVICFYPSEKIYEWRKSIGMIIPTVWKNNIHFPVTTNQMGSYIHSINGFLSVLLMLLINQSRHGCIREPSPNPGHPALSHAATRTSWNLVLACQVSASAFQGFWGSETWGLQQAK